MLPATTWMAATTINAKTPTTSEPLTTTAARATKKLHVKYAPFNRDRAPIPPSFRKKGMDTCCEQGVRS
jgi:hypothetical protein